ncbi:MAG: adenosylcobinamide amidohydrolase [Clostridiales bacterium]|nr:adenosylcobinamide amidohydrolase [Candidatus Blautia equi]
MDNGVNEKNSLSKNTALDQLSNGDRVIRRESEVIVQFSGKRSVICTSPLGGGIREDLTAVFNHCDMEPITRYCRMYGDTYEEHLAYVARSAGLDPEHAAGLSTACFMDRMRTARIMVNGITVTLLLTGGINKNARCAGDPATLWEENGMFSSVDALSETYEKEFVLVKEGRIFPKPGTINIILHIDTALSPGALAGAIMVLSEAKAAAIHELNIQSCYSEDEATGSGTDGIIVIANAESNRTLTQIRTDTKMGEQISYLLRETLKDSMIAAMQEIDEGYIEPK